MSKKREAKLLVDAMQSWVEEVPSHKWMPSDQAAFERIRTMVDSFDALRAACKAAERTFSCSYAQDADIAILMELRAAIALAEKG